MDFQLTICRSYVNANGSLAPTEIYDVLHRVTHDFTGCSDEDIHGAKAILSALIRPIPFDHSAPYDPKVRLSMDVPSYRDGQSYIGMMDPTSFPSPVYVFAINFTQKTITLDHLRKSFGKIG